MRIALVVHKFPPASLGGTETYTLNLARELSKRGHQVSVFYRNDGGADGQQSMAWEERDGFRAYRVSRRVDMKSAPALARFLDTFFNSDIEAAFVSFLEEVRPDVVHFQHLLSLSYRLIALARRRGLPTLLTLHDYWFLCANSQLLWPDGQACQGKALGLNCARCILARIRSPLTQPLRPMAAVLLQIRDALVRRAALQADRLIAPSRFLIQQYAQTGFPSERFIYLENGINVERIRHYPRRSSTDGRVRFTYLGTLAWHKGVHVLVDAFCGIPAEKAVLRIFGDPAVFPEYSARLHQLADSTNTFFEGSVPNEEVGRVLAETDIVVVPSLWYENSPVVIQEAFAAGIPVVASRIGALAEKVADGSSGLLFTAGDVFSLKRVLYSLMAPPTLQAAFQEVGSTAMTIQGHVDILEEIYREK